jgi:hypothetical protein
VQVVAPKRKPKTLLEVNVLLTLGSLLTPEQLAGGKKLPIIAQARLMVKAMPKATRVGEFVAMWTICKYLSGEVNVESLADFWGEPVRTMYRRLEEFREVWGPAGYETPDRIADNLIAHYKGRRERLNPSYVASLLSAPVTVPFTPVSSVIS